MIRDARYAHTNLIARDWRSLARFYTDVFGCVIVPPERDYSGPELAAGSGVRGARLQGAHLRLPGHGGEGPTLEIFQYSELASALEPVANSTMSPRPACTASTATTYCSVGWFW